MSNDSLRRFTAFPADGKGGNPAGVWIGDELPDAEAMQEIAAVVGFSETAFVAPRSGRHRTVRYFSPEIEISFCGHATIAAAIAMSSDEGDTTYCLDTAVGTVPVVVSTGEEGRLASLTSVIPRHELAPHSLTEEALDALGWSANDLDLCIPPAVAYAGAHHLVLAVESRRTLDTLDYDFERLKAIMIRENLATLQLVWRQDEEIFHSRNPFPVGGVVEDPATGAAAAALGGYLRDAGLVLPPAKLAIRQGEAMGSPSRIIVEIPVDGGIIVSGSAAPIR